MKKYIAPEFEVTEFSSEDILVISGINDPMSTWEEMDSSEFE